jgi:DNA-binding transcriptional LysR family regulator
LLAGLFSSDNQDYQNGLISNFDELESGVRDLDTLLLRTFIAVAETQSFSRAAQRVGRSQSAVSGQIQRLEDLIGRPLLDRDTRNVRLTREGEAVLGQCRQILRLSAEMIDRFRSHDVSGRVDFGSPEDFASAYLPEILGEFAARHPAVDLHVSCDLTLRLIEAFEAGGLELIVVKQDPGSLYPGAQPLWREDIVWTAGANWEGVTFDAYSPSRAVPLVLSPAPCVYRSRAIRALERRDIAWSPVFSSPSQAGCVAAVKAGLGVTVMPRAMAPPGLVVLDGRGGWPPLDQAEICLLGATHLSPAAAALAAFIRERAPRHRAVAAA